MNNTMAMGCTWFFCGQRRGSDGFKYQNFYLWGGG